MREIEIVGMAISRISIHTPNYPRQVYVTRNNGDVFVTVQDSGVYRYSRNGVLESTISASDLGITNPCGITVDEDSEVMYVTCDASHKLVKATLQGELIASVGSRGRERLQFDCPKGLCLGEWGNVYVADHANARVQVVGSDLTWRYEFQCCGLPRGLTVDEVYNQLYVATSTALERYPDGGGRCYPPVGPCDDVVVSIEGYKFVIYYDRGRLEIRPPDHGPPTAIEGLASPVGIFLDRRGDLFIVERITRRVLKLSAFDVWARYFTQLNLAQPH